MTADFVVIGVYEPEKSNATDKNKEIDRSYKELQLIKATNGNFF